MGNGEQAKCVFAVDYMDLVCGGCCPRSRERAGREPRVWPGFVTDEWEALMFRSLHFPVAQHWGCPKQWGRAKQCRELQLLFETLKKP